MTDSIEQTETTDSADDRDEGAAASRYRLTIAFHPDLSRVGEQADLPDPGDAGRTPLSRLTPLFAPPRSPGGAPLGDPHVSRSPIWVSPGPSGTLKLSVEEQGASLKVSGVELRGARQLGEAELSAGVVIELGRSVVLVLRTSQPAGRAVDPDAMGILGESEGVLRLRRAIAALTPLSGPVLVLGETGAGKELAAQAIHSLSSRRAGPFVSVNMASLSPSTAASELFGHAVGAFTGAVRPHEGLFEQADGGTLLLDEVAAAPADLQAMLLRVLEDGLVRPVGGRTVKHIDVRVIAATDESLSRAMLEGRFREPLYHRLATTVLTVPPLRERREDVAPLFVHFLREAMAEVGASAGPLRPRLDAVRMVELLRYHWPGNVRELRNVARQLVLSEQTGDYAPLALGAVGSVGEARVGGTDAWQPADPTPPRAAPTADAPRAQRDAGDLADADLLRALEACEWSVGRAAALLGVSRNALYRLIEKKPAMRTASGLSRAEIEQALAQAGGEVDAAARELRVSRRGLRLRLRALGLR